VLTLGNACAWVAGLFPERAQDEVFGTDPLARVSGALAPTARAERAGGGYRVSGRWAYNSGLWHADWTLLGIPLDGVDSAADAGGTGGTGGTGMALVPAADYRVEQTWTHVGMRATGSNSVVAEDIFVPDHRVVPLAATIDGVSVFAPLLTLILAAPQLGMGRAAVRLVREAAAAKPVTGTGYQRQADSVAFQLQLAEAALKVDTAELHSHRAAADIDSAAGHRPAVGPAAAGQGARRHRAGRAERGRRDRPAALRARGGQLRFRPPAAADLAGRQRGDAARDGPAGGELRDLRQGAARRRTEHQPDDLTCCSR